jgi:hypothetical protein
MMKDSFDVVADVISLIGTPDIKAMINGGIYADERPNNSQSIDVVVNCLGVINDQVQIGSGNVNIFAPNLESGKSNSILLRAIARAIREKIDTQYRSTFSTRIEESGQIITDTDGSRFYNQPFTYRSIQENYKNI